MHHGLIYLVNGKDRENDKLARGLKKPDRFRAAVGPNKREAFANTMTCLTAASRWAFLFTFISTFHSNSHDISGSHLSAAPQMYGAPDTVASAVCPCCRASNCWCDKRTGKHRIHEDMALDDSLYRGAWHGNPVYLNIFLSFIYRACLMHIKCTPRVRLCLFR
jgi:hypothetical protein